LDIMSNLSSKRGVDTNLGVSQRNKIPKIILLKKRVNTVEGRKAEAKGEEGKGGKSKPIRAGEAAARDRARSARSIALLLEEKSP